MKNLLIIMSIFVLILAMTGCTAKTSMDRPMSAESFELMDLSGNTVSLQSLAGEPVYIKFWASWCPICLSGLDEIDKLSSDGNRDFQVLTIVSPDYNGEQSSEQFKTWFGGLEQKNIKVLLDPNGTISMKYGIKGYPTSVFIDAEGHLFKTIPGHMDNESIRSIFEEMKR